MTDAGVSLFSDAKSPDPDSENHSGLSPITVENVKDSFTGTRTLTKEEVMMCANDPYWVRVRWILFILIWIIWLCGLFVVIYIIIVTPKCKEETPPTWWQRSPLYVLDVAQLSKNQPGNIYKNDSVIGNT